MSKPNNSLREAIHQKSRVLADIETIDACDIIWTDNGYEPVPFEMIGIRKDLTGIKDIRRWWGMLSELRKKQDV